MSIAYGTGLKGKATKLHSLVVRTVGFCERCGSIDNLQCAHIVSRRYTATRTDLRNAFCLCATCHYFFTDHPIEFARYVENSWAGPVYDELYRMAQAGQKGTQTFWQDRVDFLKDIHQRLVEGEMTLEEARAYEPASK